MATERAYWRDDGICITQRPLEKIRKTSVLARLLGNAHHQSFVIPQILDQKLFIE